MGKEQAVATALGEISLLFSQATPVHADNQAVQDELNSRPANIMQDQRQDPLDDLGITIEIEDVEQEQAEEETIVEGCDADLWKFIHRPERLQVIESCKIVTGVIAEIEPELDGDMHVLVIPDDPSIINSANVTEQKGRLVVEPICQNPAREQEAIKACQGFNYPKITIPKVGTHVRITGSYVLDKHHDGWVEIHPVTSMEVIP